MTIKLAPSTSRYILPVDIDGKSGVILMKASFINRSKRVARYTLFDSWGPIVIDNQGVDRTMEYKRDWLRALERNDGPRIRPGGSFNITIRSRVIKGADGTNWYISDGVGGTWVLKGIEAGRYKFCIRYFVPPNSSTNAMLSERFGWNVKELWGGVGVSNWVDVELNAGGK